MIDSWPTPPGSRPVHTVHLPGETEVDGRLVERALGSLRTLQGRGRYLFYRQLGTLLLQVFFRDSADAWDRRNGDHRSFRALMRDPRLEVSPTTLFHAAAIEAQCRRMVPSSSLLPSSVERMRNLWIQPDWSFVTWTAGMDGLRADPEGLLAFVIDVLDLGEQTEIFEVLQAPAVGFRRDAADLRAVLRQTWVEQRVVDLFGFTDAAMAPGAPGSSAVRARLATWDAHDALAVSWVSDLGALLASLESTPGSIPSGLREHMPPVRITGRRLRFAGAPLVAQRRADRPLRVDFELNSDIWFPWIFGSAHPESDHVRMFDNRELAAVHTPRLNRFLEGVAESARSRGGTWAIDPDATGRGVAPWVRDAGIDLERLPEHRMPASALRARWP